MLQIYRYRYCLAVVMVVTVIVSSGAATGQQAAALGIRSLHSCQTSFSGGHNTEYSRQFLWDRAKAVNSIWNYLSCVQCHSQCLYTRLKTRKVRMIERYVSCVTTNVCGRGSIIMSPCGLGIHESWAAVT